MTHKFRFIYLALTLFVAATTVALVVYDHAKWKAYKNNSYAYSFNIPKQWEPKNTNTSNNDTRYVAFRLLRTNHLPQELIFRPRRLVLTLSVVS
jgi:hypothetical protein